MMTFTTGGGGGGGNASNNSLSSSPTLKTAAVIRAESSDNLNEVTTVKRLKLELQKRDMQIEGYEYDLQDLSSKLHSLTQTHSLIRTHLLEAQNELEKSLCQNQSLKVENTKLADSIVEMRQSIDDMKERAVVIQESEDELQKSIAVLQTQLTDQSEALAATKAEKQQIEADLLKAIEYRSVLVRSLDEFKRVVSELREEMGGKDAQIERDHRVIEEVQGRMFQVLVQVEGLTNDLQTVESKYAEAQLQLAAKEQELVERGLEMVGCKSEREKFEQMVVDTKESSRAQVEAYEQKINELKRRMEEQESQLRSERSELKLAREQYEKCQEECQFVNDSLDQVCKDSTMKMEELKSKLALMEHTLLEFQSQNCQLESELLNEKNTAAELEMQLKSAEGRVNLEREKYGALQATSESIASINSDLTNRLATEKSEFESKEAALTKKIEKYVEVIQNMEERLRDLDALQDKCALLTEERNSLRDKLDNQQLRLPCEMESNNSSSLNTAKRSIVFSPTKVETKRAKDDQKQSPIKRLQSVFPLGKPPKYPSSAKPQPSQDSTECKQQ